MSEDKLIYWDRTAEHVRGGFGLPYFDPKTYITIYRYSSGRVAAGWSGGLSNVTSNDLGQVERAEVTALISINDRHIAALQAANDRLQKWLENSEDSEFLAEELRSMGENAADPEASLRKETRTFYRK